MITKFVLDIDGVLTDGKVIYSSLGKIYKIFGPHDKDGLKLLQKYIDIEFITADKTGYPITYARIVKDWQYDQSKLHIVPEESRMQWFIENCNMESTAFMGDGIHDAPILERVRVGIAPASGRIEAKQAAKYITPSDAGNGAVLDACIWLEKVINGLEKI